MVIIIVIFMYVKKKKLVVEHQCFHYIGCAPKSTDKYIFQVLYYCTYHIFGFWTVERTKQFEEVTLGPGSCNGHS